MLKRRLQRLVRVYTCQNVKLLEISCRGSNDITRKPNRIACVLHEDSDQTESFTQSDLSLYCWPMDTTGTHLPIKYTLKTLIRIG